MKNKRVIIIIFAILAALLIAGGVIYTISGKEPKKEEPEKPEKLKVEVDKEAAEHEVAKLKTIATSDKKIRIGTTPIYKYDNVCGMTLTITPFEDYQKVYLQITLELANHNEDIIIMLENLKSKKQVEYETQTLNDWSTAKGWSVKIITEQEAIAAGYVKAES